MAARSSIHSTLSLPHTVLSNDEANRVSVRSLRHETMSCAVE